MDIPLPETTHQFFKNEKVPSWLLDSEPREGNDVVFGCDILMAVSAEGETALLTPIGAGHLFVTLPDGEGYVGTDGSPMEREIRRS